jgi:glycosyltransferase involved in cell wall biosynthesis
MRTFEPGLVSIVLTTLNAAKFLPESLDSILGQTYRDFELIVVDGESKDATLQIVAAYTDPRMRVINQRHNEGKLPGALNLGLDDAHGEFLTWMQADSVYHATTIQRMVECLIDHPDVDQVYTDLWLTDQIGRVTATQVLPEPDEFLHSRGDPAGVCFMLRHSVRDVVGRHNVSAFPVHDAEYRWRIALKQLKSMHIREPLYYWRIHPDSLTGSRPWVIDVRLGVPIRQRLGLLTPAQARREFAEFDIAYAFDRYLRGFFGEVPSLVWSGLLGEPRFALNRGVWSILLRSLAANLMPPPRIEAPHAKG